MKKVIKINLETEKDLVDPYNEEHVSKKLINYILSQIRFINKKDEVEVIINKKFEKDSIGLIKTGLRNEYLTAIKQSRHDNTKQITFLLLGLLCLIVYTFIDNVEIFSQIILIGGWILIGEAIEIQLFSDVEIKRNKMVIKKILESDFIENQE